MKVKCINIYNEHTKKHENSSHFLTIGKEYIVLEISCSVKANSNNIAYRLVGDDPSKSPAIFNAKQFEIISNTQPKNWITTIGKNGFIEIGPKSWQTPNFWESCYDLDKDALEIYKREAQIIYDEENAL